MNEKTGRGIGAVIAITLVLGVLAAGLWFYAAPPQREPASGPAAGPAAGPAVALTPRERAAARAKLRRLANEGADHAAATPAGADDVVVVEFYLAEPEPVAVNDGEPKSASDFCDRAYRRRSQGDLDGAIADYDKAIRLNPEYGAAYSGRARTRYRKGDLDGTITDYNEALRRNPRDAAALTSLAIAYKRRGHLDQALAALRRSLAVDPGRWHTRLVLAGYLIRAGETKEGEELFRSVQPPVAEFELVSYEMNLAWFYGSTGRKAKFLEHLERALSSTHPREILRYIDGEPDFAPYRNDPDFRALIERHRARLGGRSGSGAGR